MQIRQLIPRTAPYHCSIGLIWLEKPLQEELATSQLTGITTVAEIRL